MSRQNYKYNKNAKWNLEDAIKFLKKPKGRIKRMRSRREGRYVNLAKRVGKKAYSFSGDDYPYFIKRWNRH